MSERRLHQLLERLDSLDELIFRAPPQDPLMASWLEAELDARDAYEHWRLNRDPESYAVYRACADRADAAQDALASTSKATS
jgi:hypothetical protein